MWDTPRQHERIAVSLEVVLESASGKRDARISDIGMGGCYIDSISHVSIGEKMFFQVHLPTGHWVRLHGEVVYSFADSGFGLRFSDLPQEERILLEQVILARGGQLMPQPSAEAEKERESLQISARPRRVLIADDDPTIRRLATAIIEKEGYAAIAAGDGQAVYDILQSDADYSAAIFDMVMPHMHGLELVRYMRSENRLQHIPVGIMTAEQDPKLWQESFAAGAGIFLPKPFTPVQMRYMLNVLISQGK
jgi:CheY-like chemotaxis protein